MARPAPSGYTTPSLQECKGRARFRLYRDTACDEPVGRPVRREWPRYADLLLPVAPVRARAIRGATNTVHRRHPDVRSLPPVRLVLVAAGRCGTIRGPTTRRACEPASYRSCPR